LAAEHVEGDLIAVVQLTGWSCIRTAGLEHAVLVAVEQDGSLTTVNALLRRVHLPPVDCGVQPSWPRAGTAGFEPATP